MRWLVLLVTIAFTCVGLYASLFNIWLTGMPGVQIEEQASYAGSIVVLTIVVFIAGMALFAWLSIRNTDRRIESKSRKQDL